MQRARERGKRPTGQGRGFLAALAVALCACGVLGGLGGCNSAQRTTGPTGDPLVGEMVPPKPGLAPPTPAGPASKSKSGVPPLQPTSAIGTAEVVQRGGDPLKGETPPLQIPAAGAALPAAAWQPNNAPAGRVEAPPGATLLSRPEPIVQPVPTAGRPGTPLLPATVPAAAWPSGVGASYDQLQEQLAKFNPVRQRQETFNGGFKFTCEVPNPLHPEFTRVYEGTARDYRSALLAVLEQINRDRQAR